ncbi:MAG: hypothetical protein AAF572_09685 [Cyanobacteria bacterium P01_B01_bin.77]
MKLRFYLSLLSLSAFLLPAGNAIAQNYQTYGQCTDAAWENLVSCSNEAASDSTANMWGTALGGAAVGGVLGAPEMGVGAIPGAATGFMFGGAGAMGAEIMQQGQCAYTYLSERAECSSYPESSYSQHASPSQSGNVIELPPVYIYPEGDPRNFQ